MEISEIIILLYGILMVSIFMWFRWRMKRLKIFKDLGIPGPTPSILFGNILELNRKGPIRCQEEWIRKYGSIVGYYHGMKPILLVADPNLLKMIFIKDFNRFCDRPESVPMRVHSFLDPIIPASDIMDTVLTNLKGEKWKEVRSILTPTFSSAKLKMMIPAVNEVTDITLSILDKKSEAGDEIDILQIFQRLTLDIICAQAFAMNVDSQRNPDSLLLRSAKVIFDLPYESKIIFLGRCFPAFEIVAMAINFLQMFIRNKGYIPPLKITQVLGEAIKQRRSNPHMKRPDLMQMMIDASASVNQIIQNSDANVDKSADPKESVKKKLKLSDLEIKASALVVFLAGYETTSSALGYTFYFLAKYQHLQRKLQEEIDDVFESKDALDCYNVSSLQSVERFVLESLRLFPPAINSVVRICLTDVDYDYVRIPQGMEINVPVDYIHHSEEFFDNPEEFNPDRFLPENATEHRSVNYWTFGVGPRKCIGVRLVALTTKITVAKILHQFDVVPVNNPKEIISHLKVNTMMPSEVLVHLKRRRPKHSE